MLLCCCRLPLLPQALSSLTGGPCELLRSVHIHGLKNDEILLLKDSRRLVEPKDSGTQVGDQAFMFKEYAQSACLSKAEGSRGQGSEERE